MVKYKAVIVGTSLQSYNVCILNRTNKKMTNLERRKMRKLLMLGALVKKSSRRKIDF